MVSGFSSDAIPAASWYALIVSLIRISCPLPTSGTIKGGWGTMIPAATAIIPLLSVRCVPPHPGLFNKLWFKYSIGNPILKGDNPQRKHKKHCQEQQVNSGKPPQIPAFFHGIHAGNMLIRNKARHRGNEGSQSSQIRPHN